MSFFGNGNTELNQFMNSQILLMENWKWIGLAIAFIAGLLLQSSLKTIFKFLKKLPFLQKHKTTEFLSNFLNTQLETPLAWISTCVFWLMSIEALQVNPVLAKYLGIFVKAGLAIHLIGISYKAVEAFGELLTQHTRKTHNLLDDQLVPMATRILKIFVVILGVLIALQNFGFNVMSVLAGLGLGGLALALAAQDTAANLFGSITIVADRPFQIGDWIKVGDTEGFVEDIGFRSTRIRTLYKSLVTIPNSVVAKEKIDNLGARPTLRIRHVLGLTYESPIERIKYYQNRIEQFLNQHNKIEKGTWTVKLVNLGDFNIQILVNFFINSADIEQEREVQEEFLYMALILAKESGVEFAYPTATHYLKGPQIGGAV